MGFNWEQFEIHGVYIGFMGFMGFYIGFMGFIFWILGFFAICFLG